MESVLVNEHGGRSKCMSSNLSSQVVCSTGERPETNDTQQGCDNNSMRRDISIRLSKSPNADIRSLNEANTRHEACGLALENQDVV